MTTLYTVSSAKETAVSQPAAGQVFDKAQLLAMPLTLAAKALVVSPADCLASCKDTVCIAAWSSVTASLFMAAIMRSRVVRLSRPPWSNAKCRSSSDMQLHSSVRALSSLRPVASL